MATLGCAPAALAVALIAACAAPRASSGLLEGKLPLETLPKAGDLGVTDVQWKTLHLALPSGLHVVVEQAPRGNSVALVFTLAVGSMQDPPGSEGLAHFVEHLVFRAKHGAATTIDEQLARLGARYNAFTTLDSTRFVFEAPAASRTGLLEIAASILSRAAPGIDQHAFEVERQVVLNELRQRNEMRVYGRVLGWMQGALFPAEHPYSRSLAGSPESLGAITPDDVRRFVAVNYSVDNATMAMSAPENLEDEKVLLASLPPRLVGDPAAPRSPRKPPQVTPPSQPPPAPAVGYHQHQAPVSLPEVWLTWSLPSLYSKNAAAVRMVTAPVVETTLEEIYKDDEDVVSIAVVPLHLRHVTVLAIQAVVRDAAKRDRVRLALLETMTALWQPLSQAEAKIGAKTVMKDAGIDDESAKAIEGLVAELAQARRREVLFAMQQQARAYAIFGVEAPLARVIFRGDQLHALGPAAPMEGAIEGTLDLGMTEVAAFASKFLTAQRTRALYIDPAPEAERPAPGVVGIAGIDRGLDEPSGKAIEFPAPPAVAPPPELASLREVTLPNGLRVWLVPRNDFPTFSATLVFPGGQSLGQPAGVGELVSFLERLRNVSLPFNALRLEPVAGRDFHAAFVHGGKRNLSAGLMLLARNAVMNDAVDWEKDLDPNPFVKVAATQGADKTGAAATNHAALGQRVDRALTAALYGTHPYGRFVELKDLAAIEAKHVRSWLLQDRNPANATLIVVGDFTGTEALDLVRGWFGGWEGRPEYKPQPRPPSLTPAAGVVKETVLVHHRPGVTQTELTLACRLPTADLRGVAVNQTVASVLGDHVYTQVRHEAGAAYSVEGGASVLRGGASHLSFTLMVDDTRLRKVIGVVRGHLQRLHTEGFDPGALSQVKWHRGMREALAYQTATSLNASLVAGVVHGFGVDYVRKLPEFAQTVTREDLATAFRVCRASTVLSFVGDEARIRAALAP